MKKIISIVTPTFNEVGNISKFYMAILDVWGSQPNYNFELIVIDNNSSDGTIDSLRAIARSDERVKVILNSANFGHLRSPYWAMLNAYGDAVVFIASDFQDPIDLIPTLIGEWESGKKVVFGVKTESKSNAVMHYLRKKYYRFLKRISDFPIIENATGFGIYDKTVMNRVREVNDPNPYFRGLICELGFNISTIDYVQDRRRSGESKNNFWTLLDMALLGIVSCSIAPIRAASLLGIFLGGLSILAAITLLTIKLIWWREIPFGIAPLGIIIFFLIGLIFLFLGLIGEYVASLIPYLKRRPLVLSKSGLISNMRNFDLTIVVPTYKEEGNVKELFYRIKAVFDTQIVKCRWNIVFIDDDSPDETLSRLRDLSIMNDNVFYLHRIGRRGLASAICEGIIFTEAEFVIVMDADLQHDEKRIPEILKFLKSGAAIVVCGRDFSENMGLSNLRRICSKIFNWIMNKILPVRISDPLAGYFGVNRDFFMLNVRKLQKNGFKILFDLLCFSKDRIVVEIKSEFKERYSGESKLSEKIIFDAIELMINKATGGFVPADFVIFCFVGAIGAMLHLTILYAGIIFMGLSFQFSQVLATALTMIFNYFNNSKITFRNSHTHLSNTAGLLTFMLICTIGAALNVLSADYIYQTGGIWWVSGLMGAVLGAIWNFILSKFFIWNSQ